jgi:hypothetical protein
MLHRQPQFLIRCLFALLALCDSAFAEPELRVLGEIPETVYRWSSDRCDDLFIPDSPARAYRRLDGTIVLMAAHYTNGALTGNSFQTLKPDCSISSRGTEDPDPSKFDDHFWVQSLTSAGQGRVAGLVSHEYMGKRHAGACDVKPQPGPQCWYSSILLAFADEKSFHFKLAEGAARVVAAATSKFSPTTENRIGFFTASNIVKLGSYSYFLSWAETPGFRGNCLFRTPSNSPEGPWLAYGSGEFNRRFASPFETASTAERCDVVASRQLRAPVRSLIKLTGSKYFVATFALQKTSTNPAGIYYVLSQDLLTWDEPRLLLPAKIWWGTMDCGAFYDYPSLIDHDGVGDFSEGGNHLYLYFTRLNWTNCQRGLDRDLVRIPISHHGD